MDWPRPLTLEPPPLMLLPPPLLARTEVAGSESANLLGETPLPPPLLAAPATPAARRCGCGLDWNGCNSGGLLSGTQSIKVLALRRVDRSGSQSSDASQSAVLLLLLLLVLPLLCWVWLPSAGAVWGSCASGMLLLGGDLGGAAWLSLAAPALCGVKEHAHTS